MIAEPGPGDRLRLSRERLRRALQGVGGGGAAPQHAAPAHTPWWDELKALPGAGIAIEAAQQWWAKHPLRVPAQLAFNAVQAVVRPLAQRHPFGLVLGALVAGGLLATLRPWRWALRPALWAGLLPQLLLSSLSNRACASQTSHERATGIEPGRMACPRDAGGSSQAPQ